MPLPKPDPETRGKLMIAIILIAYALIPDDWTESKK